MSQQAIFGEATFRTLAEAMPQLVWSATPDGTIDYVNTRWVQYTGCDLDALRRDGVKGIVHPEERELTVRRWAEAVAAGEPYEMQYRLRDARDGSYRWFLSRAVPVRDGGGGIVRWIGTATEVDAQKRARDNLAFVLEAADAFRDLFDVAAICDAFAQLAVKHVADWCFVMLLEPPDVFRTVAFAHRDPARRAEIEAFRRRYPMRRRPAMAEALARGPVLRPTVTPDDVDASADDEDHLRLLRSLSMHSVMTVPLRGAAGELEGAITLVAAESRRTFATSDVGVAEGAAARAAAAIRTARTFEEQRRRGERLEFMSSATQGLLESETRDVAETAEIVVRACIPAIADRAAIYLSTGDVITLAAVATVEDGLLERGHRARDDYPVRAGGPVGSVVATGRSRMIADVGENALAEITGNDALYLQRFAELALRSSLIVPLRTRTRTIGALALSYTGASDRRYDAPDVAVAEEIGERTALAVENALRYERERRVSQTFQSAALPGVLPAVPGTVLTAKYEAGRTEALVGGDWYDAFRLPDGRLVLSIGDVAGSGLDAAVMMGSVRQSIRTAALINPDPIAVLDAVDRIVRSNVSERYVTAVVALFDPLYGELRYASAGHPAPLVRAPSGAVAVLDERGLPLGLRRRSDEQAAAVALEPGSLLLFYTDGLTEVDRAPIGGERRVTRALAECDPAATTARSLFTQVLDGRAARDDVAMLLVRYERSLFELCAPARAHRWRFWSDDGAAAGDARRAYADVLHAHGVVNDELAGAEIVFGELVGNVARYAPGPVELGLDLTGALPVLHALDTGPGFEQNARLPLDVMAERGRGLFLVRAFAEELIVSRRPGGGSHARVVLRGPASLGT